MNVKGESIALGGRVEDPAFMAQDELVQSLRHLPISNEERHSFSVILRPSSGKNWAVGHSISACFFSETSDDFKAAFEEVAAEWFERIALSLRTRKPGGSFNICQEGRYEVRIGNFGGIGSFSSVGKTQARGAYLPSNEYDITLNIDYPGSSGSLFRFLVLHEAGHMLGIEHEHQNGNSKCKFKEDAIYDHFTPLMPGRTVDERRRAVKSNILDRFHSSATYYTTAFDPESVMIYYFAAQFYEDAVARECEGGQPDRASAQDLAGMAKLYAAAARPAIAAAAAPAKPLGDLTNLAASLQRSALPDEVRADILARALREHPVVRSIVTSRTQN